MRATRTLRKFVLRLLVLAAGPGRLAREPRHRWPPPRPCSLRLLASLTLFDSASRSASVRLVNTGASYAGACNAPSGVASPGGASRAEPLRLPALPPVRPASRRGRSGQVGEAAGPQRQRCGTRARTGTQNGCRRPVRTPAAPQVCRRFTPNPHASQGIDLISRGSERALLRLPWPARHCRAAQASLAERRSHPSRVSWTGCSPITGGPRDPGPGTAPEGQTSGLADDTDRSVKTTDFDVPPAARTACRRDRRGHSAHQGPELAP